MIVKTEEFDKKLRYDMRVLSFPNNGPTFMKGSYVDRPFGSYLTDIDIVWSVNYDSDTFLKDIQNKLINILKSKNWIFLYSHQGPSDEIMMPWAIENDSSCIYNQVDARKWFDKNKHRFRPTDLKFIEKRLFSEYISLTGLEEVYTFVYVNYRIRWLQSDIFRGYKNFDNHTYNLIDAAKKRGIVFKLVYHPDENTYIPIDFTIADNKYLKKTRSASVDIRRFYIKEWYHVLKYYRRYLPDTGKIRDEYTNIMKSQEFQISLYYQLSMLSMMKSVSYNPSVVQKIFDNLEPYIKNYIWSKDINECRDTIMKIVNGSLEDFIRYFSDYLKPPFKANLFYLNRSIEASIPISQKLIEERTKKGIKCPFLVTKPEEFDIMADIAKRALISVDKLIRCFITTCNNTNTNMHDFLRATGNNHLSLEKTENNVVLYNDKQKIGTFNLNHLNVLKAYILVKKPV